MALTNKVTPFGFRLFQAGGTREPARIKRLVAASRSFPLMIGDAYSLDASGNAFRAIGTEGSAGVVRGVVEAIDLAPIASAPNGPLSQDYLPAADAGAIIGIEDEDAKFIVKMTTAAIADAGKAFNLVNATPDTALRQSRQEGDGGTLGSGSQFVMHQIADRPTDNTAGSDVDVVCSMLTALEA